MGKTSNYRRGYVLEDDIMKLLEERGFYVARSSGSKGLCDVVAIPSKDMMDDKPLCIQCKKTTKPNHIPRLTKAELNALKQLERTHKVKVMVCVRYRMRGRWKTELLTIDEYLQLLRLGKEKS